MQPKRMPQFAYAWLDIVGHRHVIDQYLANSASPHQPKTWAMYIQLIIAHIKFLAPFLRNIELHKSVALMYKGTLRCVLGVIFFTRLLVSFCAESCSCYCTISPSCCAITTSCCAMRFRRIACNCEISCCPPSDVQLPTTELFPFLTVSLVDRQRNRTLAANARGQRSTMLVGQ